MLILFRSIFEIWLAGVLQRIRCRNNTAMTGGAIHAEVDTVGDPNIEFQYLRLDSCIFHGNVAIDQYGGAVESMVRVRVRDSIFLENRTPNWVCTCESFNLIFSLHIH